MSEKLKPCPFCGSEKIELCADRIQGPNSGKSYAVECQTCYCKTAYYGTKDYAVMYWNKRAEVKNGN